MFIENVNVWPQCARGPLRDYHRALAGPHPQAASDDLFGMLAGHTSD